MVILYMRSYFFFNDTATTEIYTLSLHDALPISVDSQGLIVKGFKQVSMPLRRYGIEEHYQLLHRKRGGKVRSEEHTSELQSRQYLVCRLLLEKKKSSNSNTLLLFTISCLRNISF